VIKLEEIFPCTFFFYFPFFISPFKFFYWWDSIFLCDIEYFRFAMYQFNMQIRLVCLYKLQFLHCHFTPSSSKDMQLPTTLRLQMRPRTPAFLFLLLPHLLGFQAFQEAAELPPSPSLIPRCDNFLLHPHKLKLLDLNRIFPYPLIILTFVSYDTWFMMAYRTIRRWFTWTRKNWKGW